MNNLVIKYPQIVTYMSATESEYQSPSSSSLVNLRLTEMQPERSIALDITKLSYEVRQLKFGIRDVLESMERIQSRIGLNNSEPYPEDITQLTVLQLYLADLESQLLKKQQLMHELMTPVQSVLQISEEPFKPDPLLTSYETHSDQTDVSNAGLAADMTDGLKSSEAHQLTSANTERETVVINELELVNYIVDRLEISAHAEAAVTLQPYDELVGNVKDDRSPTEEITSELPHLVQMLTIIGQAKVNYLSILADIHEPPANTRFERAFALLNEYFPKTRLQKSVLLEAGMGKIENLTYVLTAQELAILVSIRKAGFKVDETFVKVYLGFLKNPPPVVSQPNVLPPIDSTTPILRKQTSKTSAQKRSSKVPSTTTRHSKKYPTYREVVEQQHSLERGKKKRK